MTDHMARFVSDDWHLAISLVRCAETVQTICGEQHELQGRVIRPVGQAIAGGLLLATRLKGQGMLTVGLSTDGILSRCRVDAYGLGWVRALVPRERLAELNSWNGVDRLLGAGSLTVSKQIEHGQPYQTVLAIDDPDVPTALYHYLRDSEQVRAGFDASIGVAGDATVSHAVGIYCEALPGCEVDQLPESVQHLLLGDRPDWDPTIADDQELIDALFGPGHAMLLRQYPVRFACPCSRERYQSTLRGFGKDQILELAGTDGQIVTTCDFCRTSYTFAIDDLI